MPEQKISQTESYLGGALIGGMIGFIIGLLVAPEPGETSRNALKQAYASVTQGFHQDVEQTIDQAVGSIEQGLTELGKMVAEVKQAVEQRRTELEKGSFSS